MSGRVYLIAGEELLADEALERIRVEVGGDSLSEGVFDAAEGVSNLLEALRTPSLFGGARLVTVTDAHAFKGKELEALQEYIESPSEDAVLVLIASGRSRLVDSIKKHGTVITLEPPRGRRLVSWLRQRAQSVQLTLDERAAWALIDAVGTELRDLDAALQQLSTAVGAESHVHTEEIRRMFPRLSDERIWAFTDAVGDRRLPLAMGTLRRLLEQGDEPLMVFGALTAHIRRMIVARSYAEGGARALADALSLPQWRAERLHRQVRSYRQEELNAAMAVLSETDVEMKGGDLPPEIALERAVVQIVSGGAESLRSV